MGSMEAFRRDTMARLPEPGTDPTGHLRHTVAAFDKSPDDEMAITATSGVYGPGSTGLTWGDLREILRRLEV